MLGLPPQETSRKSLLAHLFLPMYKLSADLIFLEYQEPSSLDQNSMVNHVAAVSQKCYST